MRPNERIGASVYLQAAANLTAPRPGETEAETLARWRADPAFLPAIEALIAQQADVERLAQDAGPIAGQTLLDAVEMLRSVRGMVAG